MAFSVRKLGIGVEYLDMESMSEEEKKSLKKAHREMHRGVAFVTRGDHVSALACVLKAVHIAPSLADNHEETIMRMLNDINKNIKFEAESIKKLYKCYSEAMELFPENFAVKASYISMLQLVGEELAAFSFLTRLHREHLDHAGIHKHFDNLKAELVQQWHFRMLNDVHRNTLYKKAIFKSVGNQDTVVDIGCGTGLLSFYAAEAGAKKIVSLDSSSVMVDVATKVLIDLKRNFEAKADELPGSSKQKNGAMECSSAESCFPSFKAKWKSLKIDSEADLAISYENIEIIQKYSTDLKREDLVKYGDVSVLVLEVFDACLLGEDVLATLIHAHKEILTKGGKIIPQSGSLFVCGVKSAALARKHRFSDVKLKGLLKMKDEEVYRATTDTYNTEDLTNFKDLEYVTSVGKVCEISFCDLSSMERLDSGEEALNVSLACLFDRDIDAYVMWLKLDLTDDISINTDPRRDDRCNAWDQAIFYLHSPKTCQRNEEIHLNITCKGGKVEILNIHEEREDSFAVCKRAMSILNNFILNDIYNGVAGSMCVHISSVLRDIHLLDLAKFPVLGLLFLIRGADSLTTTCKDQKLLLKIAENNNINPEKIKFIKNSCNSIIKKNGEKYDIVISDFFTNLYAELNYDYLDVSFMARSHKMTCRSGGMIPHSIKMLGKLIYSDKLNITNRLYDKNTLGYEIAKYINCYQVSQNPIELSAIDSMDMSESFLIYEQCLSPLSDTIINVNLMKDGEFNAILTWYELHTMENGEIFSTLLDDGSRCMVHLLDPILKGKKGDPVSVMVCVNYFEFKIVADMDDD